MRGIRLRSPKMDGPSLGGMSCLEVNGHGKKKTQPDEGVELKVNHL